MIYFFSINDVKQFFSEVIPICFAFWSKFMIFYILIKLIIKKTSYNFNHFPGPTGTEDSESRCQSSLSGFSLPGADIEVCTSDFDILLFDFKGSNKVFFFV